ncbi:hypothetical protein J6590_007274 [Homalodisca vitripennis]|nr:hypothetical protein J6590_007274 [Homalodisca vitripennis]
MAAISKYGPNVSRDPGRIVNPADKERVFKPGQYWRPISSPTMFSLTQQFLLVLTAAVALLVTLPLPPFIVF